MRRKKHKSITIRIPYWSKKLNSNRVKDLILSALLPYYENNVGLMYCGIVLEYLDEKIPRDDFPDTNELRKLIQEMEDDGSLDVQWEKLSPGADLPLLGFRYLQITEKGRRLHYEGGYEEKARQKKRELRTMTLYQKIAATVSVVALIVSIFSLLKSYDVF